MKSMIGAITRNWYGRRHSEPLASFLTKGRCRNARLPQISLCNGPARHGETHDLCRIMGATARAAAVIPLKPIYGPGRFRKGSPPCVEMGELLGESPVWQRR